MSNFISKLTEALEGENETGEQNAGESGHSTERPRSPKMQEIQPHSTHAVLDQYLDRISKQYPKILSRDELGKFTGQMDSLINQACMSYKDPKNGERILVNAGRQLIKRFGDKVGLLMIQKSIDPHAKLSGDTATISYDNFKRYSLYVARVGVGKIIGQSAGNAGGDVGEQTGTSSDDIASLANTPPKKRRPISSQSKVSAVTAIDELV